MRLYEWASISCDSSLYKEGMCLHREEKACQDIGGCVGQEDSLQGGPAGSLILDFSLQVVKEIDFCYLSPSVHGVLLWQPELTGTETLFASKHYSFLSVSK